MVSRRIASDAALSSVKMRELAEESEALIDLLSRERLRPLRAEALHRKGAHHAAIEHGAFEALHSDLGLRGEITKEAAGKGIARTRGIHDLIQRQRRGVEGHGHAAGTCPGEGRAEEGS